MGVAFYPSWPRGFRLYFSENGGRRRDECLDININVARFHFEVTFWGMKRLGDLLRRLPDGPRGRGYKLGWPGPETRLPA